MPNCKAEADWCSIVEDVHREPLEAHHLDEAIDDVRDIFERIREGAPRRHVRLPKPRQVGCDEAKPVFELRHEIAEHVAGGRKAVQQKDRWRVLRPGFAIEYSDTVDIQLAERDRGHWNSFSSSNQWR